MAIRKIIPKPIKLMIRRFLAKRSSHMSQTGQDCWVIGEVFNEMRNGYFLDIGAHDGILFSNTYLLENRYGWQGICVEANPDTFLQLKKNRRATCVHACLDNTENIVDFAKGGVLGGIISPNTDNKSEESYEVVKIKTQTLEILLKEINAPREIDYLSIDVEGAEERVLNNFDFNKYHFNCITIERPSSNLRDKLEENGYILIKDIPDNDCFYIHRNYLKQYQQNLFSFYDKKYLMFRWR